MNQTFLKAEEKAPVEQLVRVVTVSPPSLSEDTDLYVEQDVSQVEEVLVEAQTMAMVKPPRASKATRSSSFANQTYGQREERGRGVGEEEQLGADVEGGRCYSDLPLPPSPRPSGRSSRDGRRLEGAASEEDSSSQVVRRVPRPPVRRRHRGRPVSERPKSAPPEKYSPPVVEEQGRAAVLLPDFSGGETSDTGGGTLETVSARSINFVRPSQRLLEREQHKRLKRHKSFFNAENLFSKKSSVVRRAESFHHGPPDCRLSGAKHASREGAREEARERAKSVDRLLLPGEEDPLVGRLIKSKSMEFLKTKILRRPSKATAKKASSPPPPRLPEVSALLGRSMFELHRAPSQQQRPYPEWSGPNIFPGHMQERRRTEGRREEGVWRNVGPPPPKPQPYDWRQDTPFWRAEGREGRSRSHASATPPPSWTPPPPQQYHALPPSYPVHQAVNSLYMGEQRMYLPASPAPPPYSSSPGPSLLEITELEDEPPARDYSVYTNNPRILELPSGLY